MSTNTLTGYQHLLMRNYAPSRVEYELGGKLGYFGCHLNTTRCELVLNIWELEIMLCLECEYELGDNLGVFGCHIGH